MAPREKRSRKLSEDEMMRDTPAQSDSYTAPGRLGHPRLNISADRRVNLKLLQALSKHGLDRHITPPSLATMSPNSTLRELGKSMAETEAGFERLYETLPNETPADDIELEVEEEQETIRGPNGGNIKLHIFRPSLRGRSLPCVVFLHDGMMVIMKTLNKVHRRWCVSLAAQGMVVVAVDFRNAWQADEYRPFPAGLDDCCAAILWVHSHKDYLDAQNVVVHGAGGGANLALAAMLKGNREGWCLKVDGVYVTSPYISNAYNWSEDRKLSELPSLVECHGYYLNIDYQAYMAFVYTPKSDDAKNPLAWPYYAEAKDLANMPPHVLEMDELDPLRDEGMAYYRKLSAAGVKCVGTVTLGHTHGASIVFRQALQEDNWAAVKRIAAFAKSV